MKAALPAFPTGSILLILLLCSSIAALAAQPPSAAEREQHILLLNSYHPEYDWSRRINSGISDTLASSGLRLRLHIEYLDTRRNRSEDYWEELTRLLLLKHRDRRFDLILTADDNALRYIRENRDAPPYQGVPVVFCGRNSFTPPEPAGLAHSTGVGEVPSIRETVELLLRLHAQTRELVILGSTRTSSSRSNLESLRAGIAWLPESIQCRYLLDKSQEELATELGGLQSGQVILLTGVIYDNLGYPLDFAERTRFVRAASPVPVYSFWEHTLGEGVVGGKLISARKQGAMAAEMALTILRGTSPEAVRPRGKEANEWMFDNNELERWDIDRALLPPGAVLINTAEPLLVRFRWVIATLLLVLLEGGIIAYLIHTIVQRRRAKHQLEENERKLSTIFHNNPAGIVITSLEDGTILDMNESIERITGYNRLESIGKTTGELGFWETPADRQYQVRQLSEKGSFKNVHIPYIHRDGTRRHGIFSAELVTIDSVRCILTSMFDVTEARRLQQEILESKERYRILFERSSDAIFLVETQSGRYLEANHAAAVLTGRPIEELTTLRTRDITPEGAGERLSLSREQPKDGRDGTLQFPDVTYRRPDGSARTASLTIIPYTDTLSFGIAVDLTDRIRAEEQLRQSQKLEAIGTLAGGIAHDFNNILTIIIGYAELLRDELSGQDELHEHAWNILGASERARDLIKQILTFSRKMPLAKSRVPLRPLVAESLKMLKAALPSTIRIESTIAAGHDLVEGDPTQLQQVLMNLCTNAFHAMEDAGGTLTVELQPAEALPETLSTMDAAEPEDYIRLTVRDTGSGIAADILDKLFDPFFTTKSRDQGTGLGLSIAYGIVQDARGAITVESVPGEGTAFHVFLPVCRRPTEQAVENRTESHGGSERILVVDDEVPITTLLGSTLKRLGYSVTTCTDPAEALETFRSRPDRFDLVLTDQTMPGMTGLQLTDQLLTLRAELPIILCTGYAAKLDWKSVRSRGVRALLEKPVRRAELARVVRALLDGNWVSEDGRLIDRHEHPVA